MGATYRVTLPSTAGSLSADSVTIIAATNRSLRILEISQEPDGTASAFNVLGIYRSTGGATSSAPVTPSPTNASAFAAAAFTAPTAWVTQPTLGVVMDRISFNANGGRVTKTYALPESRIECIGAAQLSLRNLSGTSTRSISILIEEF